MAGMKLFDEILKFNPFHDSKGRFASSGNYASFTYAPGKSRAHDLAIQRQKERTAARMPTDEQSKTLKRIESRTRNLKNEQYRVVDRDGNVILEKQGNKNSVSYSVGEARDNIPGNITIHNHPDGGTFSSADLSDIGYGATEIRAASPEGTYILRNARYGGRYDAAKDKTWVNMRDDIDVASEGFKTHRQLKSEIRKPYDEQLKPYTEKWEQRKAAGASWDELNAIAAEYTAKADSFRPQIEAAARKAYVDQYHQWYKSNAGNYGLEYEFVPARTRTRKSIMEDYLETFVKSEGDIVLDQKMNQDVMDITDAILADIKSALPIQKSAAEKSVLFIGLKISGADDLAIDGGEDPEDFHVTLAYGHFDQGGGDEDDVSVRVQNAIADIRELIPEKISFDAIGRFPASDSSDGKDVIYAQVAAGQLEKVHEELLKALKSHGIRLEKTFPDYKPHMTLAYIDQDEEYELSEIDATGTTTKVWIGHGRESTKENNYTIMKTDEDKRLVFGWASISMTVDGEQLEDLQKDMIDPEDLEEAAYEYVLKFRDTGEEHIASMRKKGKLVESCVLTAEKQKAMGIPEGTLPIGWWIGFKIEDDNAWERVKNGTYKMFSIEGRATREPVKKTKPKESEETVAKSFLEVMSSEPTRTVEKSDPNRFDCITEIQKSDIDHLEEIEKHNPYHGKDGRFTSANGGGVSGAGVAGRRYGATDTSDAAGQIKDADRYTIGGKKNSLDGYLDENGNLTPEREAVHRQIIDDLLTGKIPVEGQATMTMLGGGPASGKSSVMNPDTSGDPHAVTVDPDMMKKLLPGFKELATSGNKEEAKKAADFYHEESSALAKRFCEVAYSENYNVVYDGTGDGKISSVQKKVDGARAKGYRVEAKYVTIDTETAVQRSEKRYQDAKAKGETPRDVPAEEVRKIHANVSDISVAVAAQFDTFEVWDNNGARGQQKLIATGGGGKGLKAVPGQEDAFSSYLSKGNRGLEGFVTLPDGTVIPAE